MMVRYLPSPIAFSLKYTGLRARDCCHSSCLNGLVAFRGILTLDQVFSLLGNIFPGFSFKGEISFFNFLHDLHCTGTCQTFILRLEWNLPRQHGILEREKERVVTASHDHFQSLRKDNNHFHLRPHPAFLGGSCCVGDLPGLSL